MFVALILETILNLFNEGKTKTNVNNITNHSGFEKNTVYKYLNKLTKEGLISAKEIEGKNNTLPEFFPTESGLFLLRDLSGSEWMSIYPLENYKKKVAEAINRVSGLVDEKHTLMYDIEKILSTVPIYPLYNNIIQESTPDQQVSFDKTENSQSGSEDIPKYPQNQPISTQSTPSIPSTTSTIAEFRNGFFELVYNVDNGNGSELITWDKLTTYFDKEEVELKRICQALQRNEPDKFFMMKEGFGMHRG